MSVRKIRRFVAPPGERCGARAAAVMAEALECRQLLSGYSFGVVGTFGSSFGEPMQSLVSDSSGNLYGVATSGGANLTGGIFELASGSATPTLRVSFPVGFTSSGLTIDSSGNLYDLGYTESNPATDATEDLSVYELPAGGTSLQNIADLGDNLLTDYPASLLIDSSGNLYGTTLAGGANREGEIFEVVKGSGMATTLASFPNVGSDGIPGTEAPNEDLVMDSNGDLFGTASGAGAFGTGDGTLFELPKGGSTIQTVYAFNGTTTGSAPAGGLVMDASGDLFGDLMNDNSYNHTTIGGIFELPAGATTPTVLASFTSATGYNSFFPLSIDSSGDLFGASEFGGDVSSQASDGRGVVFELPAGSQSVTALHTFTGGSDGQIPFGTVLVDDSGNVYGTSIGPGQSGTGLIYKLTPGGSSTGGTGTGTLAATLAGKLPATSIIAGSKTSIAQTLTLTDSGTAALSDRASVALYLSSTPSIDASSIALPVSLSKAFKLKPRAHLALRLNVKSIAAGVPDGAYYLVAQVTDTAGTSDAASTATITVAPAEIDLSGSIGRLPAAIAASKKLALSITVSNTGNTAAAGSLPVLADLSTDGQADTTATQLLSASPKVNIKPGKSIRLTLHAVVPAVAANDYYVVVVLDQNDAIPDDNLANNTLAGSMKINIT
jgi:uncharacterized repeat protein (TIGR03803 family)